MRIPLQDTWQPKKYIIQFVGNISGLTFTNKWTNTVLPAGFINEQDLSVESN